MIKIRNFFALVLLVAGLTSARVPAAEPTDLGNNLSYLRVHALADSTPALDAALIAKHAFVLDVRYATASDESILTLRAALANRPAAAQLFILISPATPASVLDALNTLTPASSVTLGIAGSHPAPKIMVRTAATADREAYDAFENGTPLAVLISGKIEKDRFDEASLVQEFKSGNPDPESPRPADRAEPKSTETSEQTAILTDRVLQRAMHLHQALLALRQSI